MSEHRSCACPIAVTVLWALTACGDTQSTSDIAKALDFPSTSQQAKRAQERLKALEAKADTAAHDAKKQELERLTTLPPALPELEAGCLEAGQAFDDFTTQRTPSAELERWHATKEPDLAKVVARCTESGKPEVAACTSSSLHNASLAAFSLADGNAIIDRCFERYGN